MRENGFHGKAARAGRARPFFCCARPKADGMARNRRHAAIFALRAYPTAPILTIFQPFHIP